MTQTGNTPPVPPPPPIGTSGGTAGSAKQGMPTWAWIGIGCGCLVVLAGLAVVGLMIFGGKQLVELAEELEDNPAAAVEFAIRLNPELELVETDNEAGTVTVRNKETGEVATFDFSDIENGNFSFEGSDGTNFSVRGEDGKVETTDGDGNTATFGAGQNPDNLPSWLHLYPGASVEVGFTQQGGGQATGIVSQQTDDSIHDVAEHFAKHFESEGWEVTRNQMSGGGQNVIVVTGTSEDGTYTHAATASTDEQGKTQISMHYTGPEG